MRKTLQVLCILHLIGLIPEASAHYLWVTVDNTGGQNGVANIYFEESPAARDGHYLDHFTDTSKTWFRSVDQIEPRLIRTSDVRDNKKRWLRSQLPAAAPRSIDCYGKFGVYSYGMTKVLLHYYARNLDLSTHEQLHELARAEHMDLDLIPHDRAEKVELTVLWRGKPAVERTVHIRGPRKFRENIRTDETGRVQFTPADVGRYTFRTSVDEATPGREGDESYELIRHHATLIMTLPLQK